MATCATCFTAILFILLVNTSVGSYFGYHDIYWGEANGYCITGYLEYFLRYKQYETTTDDYFITGVFVERYPVDSSIWGSPGVNEWCHQNGRVAIKLLNGDLEHLKAIRLYFYNDDDYNCRHGYIIKICANDRSPSGVPEHPLVEVPF